MRGEECGFAERPAGRTMEKVNLQLSWLNLARTFEAG